MKKEAIRNRGRVVKVSAFGSLVKSVLLWLFIVGPFALAIGGARSFELLSRESWATERSVGLKDPPVAPKEASSSSQAVYEATAEIVHTETPPLIDGVLDEPAWKNAGHIEGFLLADGVTPPKDNTEVFLLYDAEALYVGFLCHERHINKVKEKHFGRDAKIWRDEAVEIFIDSLDDVTACFQFATNIQCEMFDSSEDRLGFCQLAWNAEWSVKTGRGVDYWVAEFRIPLRTLEVAEIPRGKVWKGNFTRCDYAGTNQNSAWGPTVSFHNRKAFRPILIR